LGQLPVKIKCWCIL